MGPARCFGNDNSPSMRKLISCKAQKLSGAIRGRLPQAMKTMVTKHPLSFLKVGLGSGDLSVLEFTKENLGDKVRRT